MVKPNPFRDALKASIIKKVREHKRNGVVSMSIDNLKQVVNAPSQYMEGAPRGTNARYYYSEMFTTIVLEDKMLRAFTRFNNND